MSKELVTVQTFATVEEAHAFRNLLESKGIRVFLTDELTVGLLWHVGGALGGVKVQVAEEDVEAVQALLADEPVSADELNSEALAEPPDTDEDCGEDASRLKGGGGLEDGPPTELEEVPQESSADALARRAFRAAVVGLFLCPPLLHLYSLWLLLRLSQSPHEVNPSQSWKPVVTFLIDVGMLTIVLLLLARVL